MQLAPIVRFGRAQPPRAFVGDTPEGFEVLAHISSPTQAGQRFSDTGKKAPNDYTGDLTHYRTFIRAPVYANGAVFGMATLSMRRKPGRSPRGICCWQS